MNIQHFFSIMFISVCVVSLVIGIFVLNNNSKSTTNRSFFFMMISINIWSLGLALATSANDVEVCEMWRRFSAIGWGTFYSILFHFLLIITGYNTILKKWWTRLFLYLPAVICIFAFAIPSGLNPTPFQLQQTEFGWINVSSFNIWDLFFYVYYIGYSITSLVFVLRWGRSSSEKNIKMQSSAIFLSFMIALILASLTDVLLGNTFAKLPQMAPIILLIPIVVIYRIVMKYGFIMPEIKYKQDCFICVIVSVILYVILAYMQIRSSSGISLAGLEVLNTYTIRGIMIQLQMLASIYLVIKQDRLGYITAVLLNAGSLLVSMSFIILSRSTEPLPGTFSYLLVFFIIALIENYKKKTAANIEEINNQRESLQISEKKLYQMVYYDTLTGLYNKDWFIEHLNQSIHTAKRKAAMIGVIFIDLDSFKSVNDTMGHKTGDELLRIIADRLSKCARENDIISRFGGDEFLINASNIERQEDLNIITDRIRGVFKDRISVQGIEYFITASVGVAVYPLDGEDSETLIKNADIAMYSAKNKGKNQCVYCSADIKNDIIKKMKLTNSLYRALEKSELYLHYQPQVDAKTQKITGLEALIRWNNEEYGMVPPDVFIPMAEQTGLIRMIGLWVIKTACKEFKTFTNIYGKEISLSINLSVNQLIDTNIADKIREILYDTETDGKNIHIEITESIAFNEDPCILKQLHNIRNLGISISIDDFGKGYSSFSRLNTFPIDLLKIDMAFVRGITSGNQKDKAIINSIIQIAKNLKIGIIAEGVETEEQFIYLRKKGCNKIQGYYFYKPMPASEVETLLRSKTESGIEIQERGV